jgi:hypothetical protein
VDAAPLGQGRGSLLAPGIPLQALEAQDVTRGECRERLLASFAGADLDAGLDTGVTETVAARGRLAPAGAAPDRLAIRAPREPCLMRGVLASRNDYTSKNGTSFAGSHHGLAGSGAGAGIADLF